MISLPDITPEFFGASGRHGLYMQFRVMQYRDGTHYPLRRFWTDKPLSKLDPRNVYFFAPGLRRFGKNVVEGAFWLWLDFDDGSMPASFHRHPTMIVSTGGGHHVYWRADDFLDFDVLFAALQRLAVLYPAADPMALDVTRFLRWPGSLNHKYVPARVAEVVGYWGFRYTARQLMYV